MKHFSLTDCKGVIPALMTCFDEREQVDDARTRSMVEYLINAGVGGLYLTGSSGECFMMTPEERNHVVEVVLHQVAGRCPVIVHVGAISTQKTIELAKFAYDAGATAISSVPPFYWHFGEEAICRYYKDVSASVDIPMVIYNIELAGILSKSTLLQLAQLENVRGMKYTARTHDVMGALKDDLGKDFMIYSGCDEMAFSGLCVGADGIIGSFYNVFPELFCAIAAAVQAGNISEGMRLQKAVNGIISTALQYDFPSVMYSMLHWRGIDGGFSRAPFQNYADEALIPLLEKVRYARDELEIEPLACFTRC